MSLVSVLASLGWPSAELPREGTLSWRVDPLNPEGNFGCAIASFRGGEVRAIADVRGADGEPKRAAILVWRVKNGQAVEARASLLDAPCAFGEAHRAFLDALAMSKAPVFQRSEAQAEPRARAA